jgi:hypothetical protein
VATSWLQPPHSASKRRKRGIQPGALRGGMTAAPQAAGRVRTQLLFEMLLHCGATSSALPIGRSAVAYFLSNTNTFSDFSPAAVVTLVFAVSVLPSLDTVRLVMPISLPAFFRVNSAVLLSTRLAERLS